MPIKPVQTLVALTLALLVARCTDAADSVVVDRGLAPSGRALDGSIPFAGEDAGDARFADHSDDRADGAAGPVARDAGSARGPTLSAGDAAIASMDAGIGPDAASAVGKDSGTLNVAAADAGTRSEVDAAAPDAAPGSPEAGPRPSADAGPQEETRWCGRIRCDCVLKGVPLYGRVQVVTSFGDFKVRETAFPDLRVKETTFPSACGEWQFVDAFGDFTVEWVTAFEDFSIQYDAFPGLAATAN